MVSGMTGTIGIYARLSVTPSAGDPAVETSTSRQVQDCHRHAQQHGLEVTGVYRDEGLSGFKEIYRPEFERMLEDLRRGVIDGVMCWKVDRLCRNDRDFERVWRLCEQTGARVISLHEQFDSSTPDGEEAIRLMMSFARMESQNSSLRLQRYVQAAANAGKIHAGPRRFGYERDGVTVRADEAEVVREAAQRLLAGASLRSIVADLNSRGIRGARGKPLSARSLGRILKAPRTAAIVVYRGEEVASGTWEPILDRPMWEQVRHFLDDPSRSTASNRVRRHLLGGFLICGIKGCGKPLVSRPKYEPWGTTRRYICTEGDQAGGRVHLTVAAEPVERLVVERVLNWLDGPRLARMLADRANSDRQLAGQLVADECALVELSADFYQRRLISRDEFSANRDELECRIRDSRLQLAQSAGWGQLAGLSTAPGALRAVWNDWGLDQRRRLLALVVDRVLVLPATHHRGFDPDRIQAFWRT
jgi:DNA invertase Pin-like site-specific DNA recombinase